MLGKLKFPLVYLVFLKQIIKTQLNFFFNNCSTGVMAMKRLLGIIDMNPEVDPSEWDHTDVSYEMLVFNEQYI